MNNNLAFQEELQEELIDGRPVLMAPASINHVVVSGNIFNIFKNFLKGKTCIPLGDGALVYLTDKDHVSPDMMVICDRSKIQSDGVHGAPDLVVEVLSPSTAKLDKTYKKDLYARCGVKEYWLVNPGDRTIDVYRTNGTEFVLHDIYASCPSWMLNKMPEEKKRNIVSEFKCSLYEDLVIPLDEVFSGILT